METERTAETASSGHARELPLRFVGSGSEYFRIWIVNLLLTLVTLGLYYPFAKVRRLVYFHGATEIGGQPLAFLGDPWKMLRGYVLVALMSAAYAVAVRVSPASGAVALIVVALLWPALWHSSLRFRLANTAWRGLRFRFTGSRGGAYAVMALPLIAGAGTALVLASAVAPSAQAASPPATAPLIGLLPIAVASVLAPGMLWLMRRYQHNHYAWGSEASRFGVGVGRFYLVFAIALALLVIAAVGSAMLFGAVLALGRVFRGSGPAGLVLAALGGVAVYAGIGSILSGYLGARLQNLAWNGTSTPHAEFSSTLSARSLIVVYLRNWLLMVVTLGLYYPFAAVATARVRAHAMAVLAGPELETALAAQGDADESAAGDAAGDFFGIDIGL